ncbi:MAG: hypothetical protein ACAI35_00595 [Candidatus Methylacidiphilales bacterium]|nr:hypothetical protein [Candidatus Methylacidiphilales bacterium]
MNETFLFLADTAVVETQKSVLSGHFIAADVLTIIAAMAVGMATLWYWKHKRGTTGENNQQQ